MLNDKRISLKQMLETEQVFAPCIWDCFSAKAALLSGFRAILLSGGALSACMSGFPDIGLITADDLVRETKFICDYSQLPLIVDADDGYGESPLTTYRLVKRLAEAGAAAVTIEDSTGFRGFNRWIDFTTKNLSDGMVQHPVIEKSLWLSKVKAALKACEGTDCIVIARTEAKFTQGLDAAIDRVCAAHAVGADMTLIMGILRIEEAKKVSEMVPGWKMWPDVQSKNGVPDVEIDAIAALGFNLVTTHIFERPALCGALDAGLHTVKDRNTVYADNFRGPEYEGTVNLPCYDKNDPWLAMEAEFLNV